MDEDTDDSFTVTTYWGGLTSILTFIIHIKAVDDNPIVNCV